MAPVLEKPLVPNKVLKCGDNEYEVREMTAADYGEVRSLVPGVSTCSSEHSEEKFTAILALPTYHPFVAVIPATGKIVAYAELYRLPHVGRNFDARLERVIVETPHRRQGLASQMCAYLVDCAETLLDCNRIELTVEKPDARHIYVDKLGFAPVETSYMRLRLPRTN